MKKPSALACADLHWREDNPICRTDNFLQAQINKFKLAKEICNKYKIPLIAAGDIFEYWKNAPNLIRIVIETMPDMICIPGQHDLPKHSLELYEKSSLAVLQAAGRAIVFNDLSGLVLDPYKFGWEDQTDWRITGFPYGSQAKPFRRKKDGKRIVCLIHELVTESIDPFPNANATKGNELQERLKGYDLILSGDNHQQFVIESNNRLLINPGSVSRQESDQKNHKPKFYLWFAEDNSYEEIEIPIDLSVVISTHIETKKEKEDRIDAYVDAINSDYEVKLDYKKNLKSHIESNKNEIEKETEEFIWQWTD